MASKRRLLSQQTPVRSKRAAIAGGSSVVVGGVLLIAALAAGVFATALAVDGTLTPGASIVASSGGIGGQAVVFRPQTAPTSTPTPTGTPKPTATPTATPKPTATPSPTSTPIATDGCTSNGVVAPCLGSATTGASGWGTPVFDDEFNGTSLNTSNWASTWFGGGTMNNVSTSASNVAVSGGDLILTLGSSSSGALINTNPSAGAGTGFTFGMGYYIEARIFFPGNGSGIYNWPAFWTDGQSWPTDGESDIAEVLGGQMTSNYHSPQGSNNGSPEGTSWGNSWHTYALDRQSGTDTIYWDGKEIRSYSSDDGGAPQYIILNIGCSGGCVTGTSSQVKVDYVRAWK